MPFGYGVFRLLGHYSRPEHLQLHLLTHYSRPEPLQCDLPPESYLMSLHTDVFARLDTHAPSFYRHANNTGLFGDLSHPGPL